MIIILGIITIAGILMLPMFMNTYHIGHDTEFHITNILAIQEQILENKIPTSPISPHIANDLGYGTRLFYPPLAHTLTAYLSALVFNGDVLLSIKVIHFFLLALSGITMYEASYRFTKSKKVAFFASIIYMTFPYHLSDIYIRDALAECAVFVFLPMIISSIHGLFYQDKKHFYLFFILGYSCGILSHLTMMIYFTIFLSIFLLISYRQVFKKKFIIPFSIASGLVLLITSFFWIGLLTQKLGSEYAVFYPSIMAKRIATSGLWPLDYINCFQSIFIHDVEYYFYPIVIVLLYLTLRKYKKESFPYMKNFILIGILTIILSLEIIPWKYAPDCLKTIQFPWRLLTFSGLMISMVAPYCLKKIKDKRIFILTFAALLISCYPAIHFSSDVLMDMNTIKWNKGMGWQKEYLTVNAKNYLAQNKRKQEIYSVDDVEVKIIENQVPDLTWQVETKEKVTLELPRIYYKGYVVEDSKGNQYPLRESKNGFLEVELPSSGTYSLTYPGTLGMRIARRVSVLTILVLLGSWGIILIRDCRRKKVF